MIYEHFNIDKSLSEDLILHGFGLNTSLMKYPIGYYFVKTYNTIDFCKFDGTVLYSFNSSESSAYGSNVGLCPNKGLMYWLTGNTLKKVDIKTSQVLISKDINFGFYDTNRDYGIFTDMKGRVLGCKYNYIYIYDEDINLVKTIQLLSNIGINYSVYYSDKNVFGVLDGSYYKLVNIIDNTSFTISNFSNSGASYHTTITKEGNLIVCRSASIIKVDIDYTTKQEVARYTYTDSGGSAYYSKCYQIGNLFYIARYPAYNSSIIEKILVFDNSLTVVKEIPINLGHPSSLDSVTKKYLLFSDSSVEPRNYKILDLQGSLIKTISVNLSQNNYQKIRTNQGDYTNFWRCY